MLRYMGCDSSFNMPFMCKVAVCITREEGKDLELQFLVYNDLLSGTYFLQRVSWVWKGL